MKPIQTEYDGTLYRSRTEARWAVAFDRLGWPYDYEREGFDLDGEWYLPDFYLPDFSMWFEVKGADPTERELRLVRKLREATKQRVVVAIGPPSLSNSHVIGVRPQLIVLDEGRDEADERWGLLQDRRNENQFWLVQEEFMKRFSIGPSFGKPHDREPIVSRALEAAYKTATAERFDGSDAPRIAQASRSPTISANPRGRTLAVPRRPQAVICPNKRRVITR